MKKKKRNILLIFVIIIAIIPILFVGCEVVALSIKVFAPESAVAHFIDSRLNDVLQVLD